MRLNKQPRISGDPALIREIQEHAALANRIADGHHEFPSVLVSVITSEPSYMAAGMLVIADGTTWDPGSGAGLYRRNVGNTAWVFIG